MNADRRAILLGRPTHNIATGRKLIDLADAVSPMEQCLDRATRAPQLRAELEPEGADDDR